MDIPSHIPVIYVLNATPEGEVVTKQPRELAKEMVRLTVYLARMNQYMHVYILASCFFVRLQALSKTCMYTDHHDYMTMLIKGKDGSCRSVDYVLFDSLQGGSGQKFDWTKLNPSK